MRRHDADIANRRPNDYVIKKWKRRQKLLTLKAQDPVTSEWSQLMLYSRCATLLEFIQMELKGGRHFSPFIRKEKWIQTIKNVVKRKKNHIIPENVFPRFFRDLFSSFFLPFSFPLFFECKYVWLHDVLKIRSKSDQWNEDSV